MSKNKKVDGSGTLYARLWLDSPAKFFIYMLIGTLFVGSFYLGLYFLVTLTWGWFHALALSAWIVFLGAYVINEIRVWFNMIGKLRNPEERLARALAEMRAIIETAECEDEEEEKP